MGIVLPCPVSPFFIRAAFLPSRWELEQPSSLFTMPAGVPWPRYLKMLTASMLAMFAGAEVVHQYYRPDLTIPEVPPKPGELRTELLGLKGKKQQVQPSQQ
ncbi:ubiquinol-cytochrome-c reductase complex assembly factor 6 isoform X1 [Anolis carolinensis]|nr:PREDICTED: uncharacterized protein C12orf73 homolog isoform X1 [Anolis carolinensis]|eukprot:XP_003220952.2 PREDICTED: uncharacterized protein C12orf73 homolog isoform X1 [Anolis carolinensis]